MTTGLSLGNRTLWQIVSRFARQCVRVIYLLVLASSGIFSAVSAAEFGLSDLSTEVLEERIDRVKNDASLSEAQQAKIIGQLQLTINRSKAALEQKQQARIYAEALTKAATQQAAFEKKTSRLKEFKLPKSIARARLAELEALVTKDSAELAALRKRANQLAADIKNEKSFDIQAALETARQQKISDTPVSLETPEADESQRMLEAATRYLQQAQIENLEQRLLSRNLRLSLWEAEQKFLAKQISILEDRSFQIQALVTRHRQSDANRTLERSIDSLASLKNEPRQIQALAQTNLELAEEFSALVLEQDLIVQQKESASKEALKLQRKYTSLTEQLGITQLGSSPEFAAALRKQRDQLSDFNRVRSALKRQKQALTDSRLAQFRIDALREIDVATGFANLITELKNEPDVVVTAEHEQIIKDLLNSREAILEKLSSSYWTYIGGLTSLTVQNSSLITQSKQYAELLDQQLLWMPSSNAVGISTLSAFNHSLGWLFDTKVWWSFGRQLLAHLNAYLLPSLGVAMLIVLLILRRPRLLQSLANMKDQIGKVNRDKISLSAIAVLVTFLLALPGPLALLLLVALVNHPEVISIALADALTYAAVVYLILKFIQHSARKRGLLDLHFKWNIATVTALRKNLPWFTAIIIPAVTLNLMIESTAIASVRDSLGRVVFITETIAMAIFARRVLVPQRSLLQHDGSKSASLSEWTIHYLRLILIIFVPLILVAMSIYGYHYTAVQLENYLLNSVLVILSVTLVYGMAQRAFAINERRLALERLRAKRAAAIAKSEDNEDSEDNDDAPSAVDLQAIDLQTISKQTKALLKLVATIAVGLALWNVWSGIFPAFKPLINIHLWEVLESVGGVQTSVSITLWNLLLAMASIVITFLAARNISGVLEAAFFSRMSLQIGTGYAITKVAQYLIVITGTVIALQWLGAQWSKLQWLIAALSVGLGFGLQEIVANFVSGIVILFERPIRIGDTVTVGDQWGTVTRIRMRATTIIDWDHREIIVPNKAFTQDRLTNWTLTDPITRRKIDVGVAYGSDIDLVESVLLGIANANAKVLEEPVPEAYFLKFGESSLEFCLRIFVRGHREHAAVVHEIHKAIDREFRVHKIEIAFPQQDIHFDPKPIDVRLVEHSPEDKKS